MYPSTLLPVIVLPTIFALDLGNDGHVLVRRDEWSVTDKVSVSPRRRQESEEDKPRTGDGHLTFSDEGSLTATSWSEECVVRDYDCLAPAVAKCTQIVLKNLRAPTNSSIDLRGLLIGTTVTFHGKTTFETTADKYFTPIIVSGRNITVTGAPGHVIDGNGEAHWDGKGSNGGSPKPNGFFHINETFDASIRSLHIRNWPTHGINITYSQDVVVSDLTLDNTDGKEKGHNTDGFGIGNSDRITVKDSVVINQDDCVAVSSGADITVSNMTCTGGHGFSVGSVGGKRNNTVTRVTFANSTVTASSNGVRIKTNAGTTGCVEHVLFENILLTDIDKVGLDVQQDYLNAGPTGEPTDGVWISDVRFVNVTGTATGKNARNYYILCGDGSCSDFQFENVHIEGGEKESKCNFPDSGCPPDW